MKIPFSFHCCVLIPLCSLAVCGCGSADAPERASIVGEVTFNGESVEAGSIQFIPEVGVIGKPVATQITNGKYELSAGKGPAVGKNKIVIQASKKTGKQVKNIMGELEDERVEFIPKKYNESSELFIEIKSGSNTKDFSLE